MGHLIVRPPEQLPGLYHLGKFQFLSGIRGSSTPSSLILMARPAMESFNSFQKLEVLLQQWPDGLDFPFTEFQFLSGIRGSSTSAIRWFSTLTPRVSIPFRNY
jgi:hypothetical protein